VRKIIFFTLILLYKIFCIAEGGYFDFSLSRYLIDENREMVVDVKYRLDGFIEDIFIVKPVIENGTVEIFNPEKNLWASSFSLVSDLPDLKKEMLIRVKGFGIEKTNLYFEILNLSDGQVHLTPKKEVWSKKVYEKYLENLNKKIERDAILKNEAGEPSEEIMESVVLKDFGENSVFKKLYQKITNDYFHLLVFFDFLIFFYIGFGKNKNNSPKLDFKSRTYGVNGKIP